VLTSADVASINMGEVLRYLHENGPQTRASLAARLGQSRSASGSMLVGLAELRLVSIGDNQQTGRVGRPSANITVGNIGPVAVCIDFCDTVRTGRVLWTSIGLGGKVLRQESARLGPGIDTALLTAVVTDIEDSLPRRSYLAGVMLTGGRAEASTPAFDLNRPRQEHRAVRVSARHHVELAAWGELTRGAGTGADSVLVLESGHPYDFYLARRGCPAGVGGSAAPLTDSTKRDWGPHLSPPSHPESPHDRARLLQALLSPDVLVLSGPSGCPDNFRNAGGPVKRAEPGQLGNLACSHGAAELLFRPWFEDPVRAEARYRGATAN
jgi:hypothetical protein